MRTSSKLVCVALAIGLVQVSACANPIRKQMNETPRTLAEEWVVSSVSYDYYKAHARAWQQSEIAAATPDDPGKVLKLQAMKAMQIAMREGDGFLKASASDLQGCLASLPTVEIADGVTVPDESEANIAASFECGRYRNNLGLLEQATSRLGLLLSDQGIAALAIVFGG